VFNRISVWLDESAPDKGAFARAVDWAARLHVPLHAVAAPVAPDAADPLSPQMLEACRAACVRKGVYRETEFLLPTPVGQGGFFREGELSAFGANLPFAMRDQLLRESLARPKASVMVCSTVCPQVSRGLVLHQARGDGVKFLLRIVRLCRALAMSPVVLTVARSERRAADGQKLAREVFLSNRLDADFDLIAGCDVRTAVARAAHARGCSTVFLDRPDTPPWRRWLRGDTVGRLLPLADQMTLVMLPAEDRDAAPSGPGSERN
jgi:hypothetical protein